MRYSPARYYDPETNRFRWAVVCGQTYVYYFPKRRGRLSAERLAKRLNAAVEK